MANDITHKTMWLTLSLCDEKGQHEPGLALEVRSVSVYSLSGTNMIVDLLHIDGEAERICFKVLPLFGTFFRLGTLEYYVAGIKMGAAYPNCNPVSKAEYRERCGKGKLLNAYGHFIEN